MWNKLQAFWVPLAFFAVYETVSMPMFFAYHFSKSIANATLAKGHMQVRADIFEKPKA